MSKSLVAFEDERTCTDRTLCQGDVITVPDRRFVNICEKSQDPNPWSIDVVITDTMTREYPFDSTYKWAAFELPKPATPAPIIGTPTPPTPPTPTPPTPTWSRGECCTQRPNKIVFKIDPIDCDESENEMMYRNRNLKHKSKGKDDFSCEGPKPSGTNMTVEIRNKYGTLLAIWDDVDTGDVLTLDQVHTNLVVKIDSQVINFHASCSKPMCTGNKMGSFTILDFKY